MMQTMSTFILNIRPEDDAALDTETLKRHGVAALSSPVMSVSPLSVSFGNPDNISGIIFTSRHAVALFVKDILSGRNKPHDIGSWLPKPIYVVGSATARVARAAGFQHITKGDGGGASLVSLITKNSNRHDKPLLWPSARHKSFDMTAALQTQGVRVNETPLYETIVTTELSDAIISTIKAGEILAVMSLSARTSALFVDLLTSHDLLQYRSSITLIAGSQAIADAANTGWKDVLVARYPRRTRLLAIASMLFKRHLQDDA